MNKCREPTGFLAGADLPAATGAGRLALQELFCGGGWIIGCDFQEFVVGL